MTIHWGPETGGLEAPALDSPRPERPAPAPISPSYNLAQARGPVSPERDPLSLQPPGWSRSEFRV